MRSVRLKKVLMLTSVPVEGVRGRLEFIPALDGCTLRWLPEAHALMIEKDGNITLAPWEHVLYAKPAEDFNVDQD